jgi:hypothetical protein
MRCLVLEGKLDGLTKRSVYELMIKLWELLFRLKHILVKEKACHKNSDNDMPIYEIRHFCTNRYYRRDPVSLNASILMKICGLESINVFL